MIQKLKRSISESELYLNEAVMEEETKQLSGDIPVLPVNPSHLRPHDLLGARTRVPVEIVLQILRRHVSRRRLREEVVEAAVSGSQRDESDEWFDAGGRERGLRVRLESPIGQRNPNGEEHRHDEDQPHLRLEQHRRLLLALQRRRRGREV